VPLAPNAADIVERLGALSYRSVVVGTALVREGPCDRLVREDRASTCTVGGRGQGRVERVRLEQWIQHAHHETARFVQEHPLTGPVEDEGPPSEDEGRASPTR
jgi:hypothetical protein